MDHASRLSFPLLAVLSCWIVTSVGCWDVGHLYLYNYTASIQTTGATSSSSTFRIEAGITVRVQDGASLSLKLNDARSWIKGPDGQEVEHNHRPELESEFLIFMDPTDTNAVESLGYHAGKEDSSDIPNKNDEWLLNVQRGLASLISLRLPPAEADLRSSQTYRLSEDEVTGRCDNVYEWSPLLMEDELLSEFQENHFEVIKTRDFDHCDFNSMPIYNVLAPPGWRCRPGSAICENVQSRSLITRYRIGGSHSTDVEQVESREDFVGLPWGVKTDEGSTYRQIRIVQQLDLILKKAEIDYKSSNQLLSRRIKHASTYHFDMGQGAAVVASWEENVESIHSRLMSGIKNLYGMTFRPEELISRRVSSLRKELLDRLMEAGPEQLAKLTSRAQKSLTPSEWSLYIQLISSLGSSAALDITKELMENGDLSVRDTMRIISAFSLFLRNPSDHVLSQLLSLLDVEMIKNNPDLRQTTMVSLASFFRMARIDLQKADIRFPPPRYRQLPFFNKHLKRNVSDEDVWPARLVTRLSVYLNSSSSSEATDGDRSAALSAFNILGHPSLIPVVIPLIEGKVDVNPSVRTKAVLSLHKLAHHGNAQAIRILHTVFSNPNDDYQVRLGAFTLLMLSSPPDTVWQSVAARTWFEPSRHVATFVYTTLETLASFNTPQKFLRELSEKAKKVLRLAKPAGPSHLILPSGGTSSANYIWSQEERHRLLASYLRLETFSSAVSLVPKELYGRLNLNIGAIGFDFLEFEVHGHRIESLLTRLIGKNSGAHKECHQRLIHPVDALLRRLNMSQNDEEVKANHGEGFVHLTLMESVENFWSFDREAVRMLKGMMSRDEGSLNGLRWLHQLPIINVDIRWANSMGFLTRVVVDGQMSASIDGSIEWTQRPALAIHSQLNPMVTLEMKSSMGVELDWKTAHNKIETSSDVLILASLPGRFDVKMNGTRHRSASFDWTPEPKNKELVFLHKSQCSDGFCPQSKLWAEQDKSFSTDWDATKILSTLSSFWLPESPPATPKREPGRHFRQLSWSNSIHPSSFRLVAQLNEYDERDNVIWSMMSGTKDLVRGTRPDDVSNGHLEQLESGSYSQDVEESSRSSATRATKPTPLLALPLQVEAKPIALSAPLPSWLELPWRMGWNLVSKGGQITFHWHPHLRLSDEPISGTFNTTSQSASNASIILQGIHRDYTGECRLAVDEIVTFDGVIYDPKIRQDPCGRYLAVASRGVEDKLAVLIDGSAQVVELIVSEDVIHINVSAAELTVNHVLIPLGNSSESFRLISSCHSPLLLARRLSYAEASKDGILLELAYHGIRLDIYPGEIRVKTRGNLGGRLQGLCGDMNGERLFEFRDPRRCVLPSGQRMASAYRLNPDPLHCSYEEKEEALFVTREGQGPVCSRHPIDTPISLKRAAFQ